MENKKHQKVLGLRKREKKKQAQTRKKEYHSVPFRTILGLLFQEAR